MVIRLHGMDFMVEKNNDGEIDISVNGVVFTDLFIYSHYNNRKQSIFDELYDLYQQNIRQKNIEEYKDILY